MSEPTMQVSPVLSCVLQYVDLSTLMRVELMCRGPQHSRAVQSVCLPVAAMGVHSSPAATMSMRQGLGAVLHICP